VVIAHERQRDAIDRAATAFDAAAAALASGRPLEATAIDVREGARALGQVLGEFSNRHEHVEDIFRKRFARVKIHLEPGAQPSPERQMLIGAYFTHEYSPESAALFNPSIVPHPDQSGLPKGALRFVLSLRATGEGHISSITFRTGSVSALHRITLTPPVPFLMEPERVPDAAYVKGLFAHKLQEAGVQNDFCRRVLDQLHEDFTLKELHAVLLASGLTSDTSDATATRAARGILLLAESNYEVNFAPNSRVSQRVLFPSAPSQSNGIEDARFVRFQKDDGSFTYYATYTAYDGKITLPQLLETPDFVHFKFSTLNGPAVQNKGMAMFPRKIDGRYAMISRQDDENILIIAHTDGFWEASVDNASGVAAMLGLAEYFSKVPKDQRRRTITFMSPIGHHVTPDLSLQKLHDNRATFFARTALIINAEHVTTTQTYLFANMLRKSNAATAHRFFVGRSRRLAQILVENFRLFGVALYELPSTRFGVAGDLVKLVDDAPGIEVIESNAFYHSDEDKPAVVPAPGLESITRAYAKIIDDINKLDLKDIVDPPAASSVRR